MKIKALLLLSLAALALPASTLAVDALPILNVNVSGTAKYEVTDPVTMKNKIVSVPVNAAFLCAQFNVLPKNYAVVYDTSAAALELAPKSATAMLPVIHILGVNSTVENYNSDSPLGFTYLATIVAGAETVGTEFDALSAGAITVAYKQKLVMATKVITSVMGTATTVATGGTKLSLYNISFAGASVFKAK